MTEPPSHTCHATGCTTEVPERYLMCRRHWWMVPRGMQQRLWQVYRPGQEITKDPSPEYLDVAMEIIHYVSRKEGRS